MSALAAKFSPLLPVARRPAARLQRRRPGSCPASVLARRALREMQQNMQSWLQGPLSQCLPLTNLRCGAIILTTGHIWLIVLYE